MKTFFITGATGYIGEVVAERLLARGVRLEALVRTEEKAARLEEKGIKPIIGDLADAGLLKSAAERSDGVVHLAVSHTPDNERLDTAAVDAILAGLSGSGKPFVYTSGTLIYGDTSSATVDEAAAPRPLPFLEWKANQERKVLNAAEHNVRSIVIRPVLVYGKGGGIVQAHLRLCQELGTAKYIGDGSNAWSTIHVDDLASLYDRALTDAQPGSLYNAASREQVTMRELMGAIARKAKLEPAVGSLSLDEAMEVLGPNAWPLSISQRISGLKAEKELQWEAGSPSILEDIVQGSYS